MTPFEGSKCLLLLHLGWKEDYFRLLDRAMEQEDPLSPITLELALCGSDTEAAINVLAFDCSVRSVPESKPMNWLKQTLYQRYTNGTLTPQRIAEIWQIVFSNYDVWEDRFWFQLQFLWDYLEDGYDARPYLEECFSIFEQELKEGEKPCS